MPDQSTRHYIDRATIKNGARSSGETLSDQEYEDGIDVLNDLMEELEGGSQRLGFSRIQDKEDLVTIPYWAAGYVKTQLAVDLAPEYDLAVPPALAAELIRKRESLNRRLLGDFDSELPETLPRGTTGPWEPAFVGNPGRDDVETDVDCWLDEDGTPVEENDKDVT